MKYSKVKFKTLACITRLQQRRKMRVWLPP